MKRRHFIQAAGATALSAPLMAPMVNTAKAQAATVRWWYHFDNPQNTPNELIAQFEKENPASRSRPKAFRGVAAAIITTVCLPPLLPRTHPIARW